MAATVVMRQSHLLSVSKTIPRQREESKFYNSTEEEIMEVLRELSMSNVSIVYVVVDKYDYTGRFYGLHGNSLYEAVLRELLAEAFATVKGGDANVFLDRSSFVTLSSFRTIAGEIAASVGCNLWFLFLLLYDRIMETRLVRFLRSIAGVWRSLGGTAAKPEAVREIPPADTPDIIGKSRFRMASTRTTAAIPTQEAATSEKGIELTEEEATFDDGNTETVSRPAQIPEDKLDETFTSLTPSELEFGEDEPEEETPDAPRASGSSFDEIDDAVRTAKNPEATTTERERAAKVFTDMEGTELYEKLMTGSSEMSIRIKGLIEIRLKKPKKDFVVPDNIEDFDIRNYV